MPLETPRALSRQIADQLRQAIESGQYPPGSLLPPEPQLAEKYGVSRATINNAVAFLRAEGLVRVLRGRGTEVRRGAPLHRTVRFRCPPRARQSRGSRASFDIDMAAGAIELRAETAADDEPHAALPDIARELELAECEPNVVSRTQRVYAGGVPVQLEVSYVRAVMSHEALASDAGPGAGVIVSPFADTRLAQAHITESLRVRSPTAGERSFLRLDDAQQVFEIIHTGRTEDGRPVVVTVQVMPTDWILDCEWSV